MLNRESFVVKRLTEPSEAKIFASFLPKELTSLLSLESPESYTGRDLIAIGCLCENIPLGLALAAHPESHSHIVVEYLFVVPSHRNRGIGTSMLDLLLQEGKQQGIKVFTLAYPKEQEWTSYLENILTKQHWHPARPFMLICRFDVFVFSVPWIEKNTYQYPEGYEEFLWEDLTTDEKQRLQMEQKQGVFSSLVSPFIDEESIESLNSLGVRYQGRVVAWMITHREPPDTIRYKTLYVEKGVPKSGMVMAKLLADSICLHLTARTSWAILEVPLIQVPHSWIHFIERRLVPFADQVTRLSQAWINTNEG